MIGNNIKTDNISIEPLESLENSNKKKDNSQSNQEIEDQEDDEIINTNNKKENNLSDSENSDIDDPKYRPTGKFLQKTPIQNDIMLITRAKALQKEANLVNQTMKELENENLLLKNEIMKNKQKINNKEDLNNEFQNLYPTFKQKYEQFEEKNRSLEKIVKELEQKLYDKEKQIQENNKYKNIQPQPKISNETLFNDLQNQYNEKSKLLNKEYLDKEEKVKNKYMKEIESTCKTIE